MRRHAFRVLTLLCAILAATGAALAQTPAPPAEPWHAGTDEFIVQGTIAKDQLTNHWQGKVAFVWGHFVTANTEIGAITSYDTTLAGTGAGVGAYYEWAAVRVGGGDFILGGDAQRLTGDLTQAATYQYATRVGYKKHVGKNAALRASLDFSRALQRQDPAAANLLNDTAFVVAASIALPK